MNCELSDQCGLESSYFASLSWTRVTCHPCCSVSRPPVSQSTPQISRSNQNAKNPCGSSRSNGDWSSTSTLQRKTTLTSTVPQVPQLTSDSELSSSARVGALRSLFLWLRGRAPPWLGPVVPLAKDWVLTAFLDASGESADEKWMDFIFMSIREVSEGKTFLLSYIHLNISRLTFDGFHSDVAKYGDNKSWPWAFIHDNQH